MHNSTENDYLSRHFLWL